MIKLTITNGNPDYFACGNDNITRREPSLHELQILEDWLTKNRAKIINKLKDETNKLKVGIGKATPYQAICLPYDAPLFLVIKLLNDMHFNITGDVITKEFWKDYIATV